MSKPTRNNTNNNKQINPKPVKVSKNIDKNGKSHLRLSTQTKQD